MPEDHARPQPPTTCAACDRDLVDGACPPYIAAFGDPATLRDCCQLCARRGRREPSRTIANGLGVYWDCHDEIEHPESDDD